MVIDMRKRKTEKSEEMEQSFEQGVGRTLQNIGKEISASGQLKTEIDAAIGLEEGKSMRKISMRKIIIGVAAACLFVSGAAFAGHTAYFSSGVPSMPEYETYAQMGEAQDRLGYPIDYVETFGNGYTFAGASIGTTYAHDENDNRIYSNPEMNIDYKKEGEPGIFLTIEKAVENISQDTEADAVRICKDITIEYREENYKFVKTDYVVTEKDKEAMESGEITISSGADKEERKTAYGVEWNKNGVHYHLGGFDVSLTPEEMMDMAEEIILAE